MLSDINASQEAERTLSGKSPLRVTISIGGPFPSPLRLAAFLEQQGSLERMVSFMPHFRIPWAEISDKRFISLWPLGYLSYIARHTPIIKHWAGYNWYISKWFDKLASEQIGECTLFNGWCTTALHSMRKAKERGAVTVLQMGSAHLETQTKWLEEEDSKFGLRRVITDRRLIEKAKQEYAEADHIVVPSQFVKRTLVEKGIDPNHISIVQDAVTRRFQPHPKLDAVFRIVTVGRVELRKGGQYLLEAFRQLKLPNAELLLVGGILDEMKPTLARYAGLYRSLGYASEETLGWAYSQSSVCVIPSVEDGWCHVTLEAMSCGIPVIVSANVGSADIVEDGVNGFVVPACNTQALMEKIELLYRQPDLCREMGRQAQMCVKERTWEKYGQDMRQVFEAVLAFSKGLVNNG